MTLPEVLRILSQMSVSNQKELMKLSSKDVSDKVYMLVKRGQALEEAIKIIKGKK